MVFQQQIIFGNAGMHQEQIIQTPQQLNYLFNVMLMEISSNWQKVRYLMTQISKGKKINVHPLENEWINFLMSNNINILEYNDSDQFVDNYFKNPQI